MESNGKIVTHNAVWERLMEKWVESLSSEITHGETL